MNLNMEILKRIETKVDRNHADIRKLEKSLAAHKASTKLSAVLLSSFAAVLVAIGGVLLKGCI